MTQRHRKPGLAITTEDVLDADARLQEPPIAPSTTWAELSDLGSDFADALGRALQTVATAADWATLSESITAMDGLYWRAIKRVYRYATHSDGETAQERMDRGTPYYQLLADTAALGQGRTSTTWGVESSLSDIRDGPLAMLEAADETPQVVVNLSSTFWTHKREQRERWLAWVVEDLADVCAVRVVGSRLTVRKLLDDHRADLPASVRQTAKQHFDSPPGGRARRAETVAQADEALEQFDPASDRYREWWEMLWTVYETAAERRRQTELHQDVRIGVGRTTVSKRVTSLKEAGLVEKPEINGATHVRLTPAGIVAVEQYLSEFGRPDDRRESAESAESPAGRSPESCGGPTGGSGSERARETRATGDCGSAEAERPAGQSSGDVSDPPNSSAGTVLPPREHGRGEDGHDDRPAAAADAATADADRSGRTTPRTAWMDRWRHDSLRSVASDGDVTLADRPATDRESHGDTVVSYDDDREEVAISVRGDKSVARMGTRLCDALLSEKLLRSVLTPEKLDGSDVNLSGLEENNVYVLQKGRCIGWLKRDEADGEALQDRLRAARNALTELAGRLTNDEGQFDPVVASEVTTDALGLFGTAAHLLDLLDVDLTVEIEFPEYSRDHHSNLTTICQFVSKLVRITSRYGHYSAERTLYEPREEKREDALGAPVVDHRDPNGTSLVNWVLAGPGLDKLAQPLQIALEDPLKADLQEDALNFAEFAVPVDVVQGWRREAVAVLLSRMSNWKHLDATRQAIAVLRALCASVHDVGRALSRLGGEESRWDSRDLRLDDLRFALAEGLPPGRILPDAGAGTVSKVVHALLAADEPLAAGTLADRAGVSTQSLRDNRDLLEAVGLVHVDDAEAGGTACWRLTLPFGDEDRDALDAESGALPLVQYGTKGDAPLALFDGERFNEGLHFGTEIMLARLGWSLSDDDDLREAIWWGGPDDPPDVRPVVDQFTSLRPWVDVLAALSGHGWRQSVAQAADDRSDVLEDLPKVPHRTGGWSRTGGEPTGDEWGRGPLRLSSTVGTRPPQEQAALSDFGGGGGPSAPVEG